MTRGTASCRFDDNRVADLYPTRFDDVALERQETIELSMDPEEHVDILLCCIGVERRHDAALAKVDGADDDFAETQQPTFPRSLGEAWYVRDEQVRPETSSIVAERLNRAIGRNKQR